MFAFLKLKFLVFAFLISFMWRFTDFTASTKEPAVISPYNFIDYFYFVLFITHFNFYSEYIILCFFSFQHIKDIALLFTWFLRRNMKSSLFFLLCLISLVDFKRFFSSLF